MLDIKNLLELTNSEEFLSVSLFRKPLSFGDNFFQTFSLRTT